MDKEVNLRYARYIEHQKEVSREFHSDPRFKVYEHLLKKIRLNRDWDVADLGCGAGTLISLANSIVEGKCVGVDACELYERPVDDGKLKFFSQDLKTWLDNQLDNSWDCIFFIDVFEHLSLSELVQVSENLKRVIRPNGMVVLHVPNGESPFGSQVLWSDLTHYRAFSIASLYQIKSIAHARKIDVWESGPVGRGFKAFGRKLVIAAMRLANNLYLAADMGVVDFSRPVTRNIWVKLDF